MAKTILSRFRCMRFHLSGASAWCTAGGLGFQCADDAPAQPLALVQIRRCSGSRRDKQHRLLQAARQACDDNDVLEDNVHSCLAPSKCRLPTIQFSRRDAMSPIWLSFLETTNELVPRPSVPILVRRAEQMARHLVHLVLARKLSRSGGWQTISINRRYL
jgi:hypothetical protein